MGETSVRGRIAELARSLADTIDDTGTEGAAMSQPERLWKAGQVLARAGVIGPESPATGVKLLQAIREWGLTPASGFVISAIRFPDEPAIVDEKGTLTFSEVDSRTNALARALQDQGVGPDSNVAIMCRDHRWFVESCVAVGKIGATALLYNTHFAGPQLKEVTEREDPQAMIHDEEFADALGDATDGVKRFVAWREDDGSGAGGDPSVEDLIQNADDSPVDPPENPGKITLLTSGSTGTPKGASRSQPNVIEGVVAMLSQIPLKAREPTMFAAPLFHAWGFLQFNMGLLLASTYVLRRKFDAEGTLKAIDEHDATALVIVPVMLQRILDLDDDVKRRYSTDSLRVVASSGGALSGDLAQRWMDEFGDNLYNFYGSTEVAWAAIAGPKDLREAPGTSGPPPPGTSIRILDEEGNEVPQGQTGEVHVGNRMLFEGYTGDGERDDVVDGHMTTGDLGYLDEEGRLFVEGRADDMIVSGGENVYPEEVEEKLAAHESVSEAAVIGVEDEQFGERLKAFVVKDGEVSEDDLKKFIKENLADYKVPREVEFLDELPRKPQGKVDKKKLEAESDEDGAGEGAKG